MASIAVELSGISISQFLAKLFFILTILAFITSAWVLISWLYKPGNFPIRKVELINKLENQKSRELQRVAGKALKGGFFSLDVQQFRSELLTKLPWVKAVSVRKLWPNKLLVSITEHKPVVRWISLNKGSHQAEGFHQVKGFELLSNEGIIFRPELTKEQQVNFEKMILLTGPQSSAGNVLKNCMQIKERVRQLDMGVIQCGMNERRTWRVLLNNGIDIKLGKENILQQLDRFVRVFSGQLKQYIGSIAYADLRYSNGFSIKWNTEHAAQTKEKVERE